MAKKKPAGDLFGDLSPVGYRIQNMRNYTIENQILAYNICFLVNGDGTEWIDADLPTPNWFKKFKHSYLIGWQIDGYFATSRNQAYLNDIIARMIFTLPVIEKLNYRPNNELQTHKIYKLKEFQALKSLPSKFKGYEYTIKSRGGHDRVFWAIKWKVEQIIAEQGEGRIVPYELLENWAKMHFEDDAKDTSTLRAKCRSVWNWYDNRDWTIPKTRKESTMTRSERARTNSKKREMKTKSRIYDFLSTFEALDCKKKNGTWNATKIAKKLGMKPHTVLKHLRDITDQR